MKYRMVVSGVMSGMLMFFCMCASASGADAPPDDTLAEEIKELKLIIQHQGQRIEELEKQAAAGRTVVSPGHVRGQDVSGRMRDELGMLKDLPGGIEIGAGMTFIGQGTPNANNGDATDGEDSRFDGSWSADIEIAKEFDDFGMAFLHMESGQGDSVEGELSVFSNVNRDAGDTGAAVEVTEAWYEQYLFDGQVTVTAGKIDATAYIDTNEYANDECTQFLGHIFRNSAVIDWPDDNNWGGRIYIAPEAVDFIDVEALYMEEDGDWENLFDNPFIAAQLNFMPAKAFDYDEEMWGGNYRTFFWYNGAPHSEVKEPDVTERGNIGFGFSCDQKITEVYGVFGRFGWADPSKSELGYDWSVGGQMTGTYWNREEDVAAIAVGQAVPGEDYKDVNDLDKAETHLEAYYAFKVNDHLTLTPDIQVIWEPNGGGAGSGRDADTIFVYGIRA